MLDAASLAAITEEARRCFLYEDAPEYQTELSSGLQKLLAREDAPDAIVSLMKAAHSLKGGAGIAQLPGLSECAHKLEDVLEALNEGRVQQIETAHDLIDRGIEQISILIEASIQGGVEGEARAAATNRDLFEELERFLASLPATAEAEPASISYQAQPVPRSLLETALAVDLEDCLQRAETVAKGEAIDADGKQILASFCDECTLLGQALSVEWLVTAADALKAAIAADAPDLAQRSRQTIAQLRSQRQQTLSPTPKPKLVLETETDSRLNLRVPADRLDRINNTLGELLVEYERLSLVGQQLQQANRTLKQRSTQLIPINEDVRAFYDRLATELVSTPHNPDTEEFDPLELDRYSDLHGTLQSLQESIVQVQENRADIDAIGRDFQASLDELRSLLDRLRFDLTESRSVPFRTVAETFLVPLQTLERRHQKSVKLEILGENTPVDQLILEQIKTPLTHLFRNAFDHGIETSQERRDRGKSPQAKITLSAALDGNRAIFSIADDGRGIDRRQVYEKAVRLGWCPPGGFSAMHPQQIDEFLFTPGFSTRDQVSSLSGRGVGLDVVRSQVERLRGTVAIATRLGEGTQFILSIPQRLSILPLLLCRVRERLLAIPSNKIWEVFSVAEREREDGTILWKERSLPVYPLLSILPYAERETEIAKPPLGLVLEAGGEAIAIGIDSLLEERELVLKPFDTTVPVPPYVAGCTVLGTGEVVPVLDPSYFGQLVTADPGAIAADPPFKQEEREVSILVVDDSIAVRRTLESLLSQSGYRILSCRDGQEALAVLERSNERVDLAISDIEMPRLDGFGLLQAIRTSDRWRELPVVMLTSRNNDRHRQKAMSLGASDYLSKPFDPPQLLGAIASLVI